MATTPKSPKDIEQHHPKYAHRLPDYILIEDGFEGERQVKKRTTTYLPVTSGQVELGLGTSGTKPKPGQVLYDGYLCRANYPSILKDTAVALVGVMNKEPPIIELPKALEELETNATDQGEPLTALNRRIQLNQLLYGRQGLMVDVDAARNFPYLVDFTAKQVINWDDIALPGFAERQLQLVVTDETRDTRDGFRWESTAKFRAMELINGQYEVTIDDDGVETKITPNLQGKTLDFIPFSFINSVDLVPDPSEVPLLGLANMALTIYRGDADYRQALFMQGQDTLVIIGEEIDPNDPDSKIIIGAGAMINLPTSKTEADAKFIGVDGQGLPEMRDAQANDLERAAQYGLQMMSKGSGAEAAETLKIRVAARTADLVNIAMASAAGLEQALKQAAIWVGADPDEVRVEANTDFIDEAMLASELLGLIQAKNQGAPLSWNSIHGLMRKGDLTQLTLEQEQEAIDDEPPPEDTSLLGEDEVELGPDGKPLPPGAKKPGDEDEDKDE